MEEAKDQTKVTQEVNRLKKKEIIANLRINQEGHV